MIRVIAFIVFCASLGLFATSAHAQATDQCLSLLPPNAERTLVIPSLTNALTPFYQLAVRLKDFSTIQILEEVQESTRSSSGLDLFDLNVHKQRGIDVSGPLVIATMPNSTWMCLAMQPETSPEDWFLALGLHPQVVADGWLFKTPEERTQKSGKAIKINNLLVVSASRVTPEISTKHHALPQFSCPVPPGEADAFLFDSRGCAALRLDPGRVKLSLVVDFSISQWFGNNAESLNKYLGRSPTLRFSAQLGSAPLMLVRSFFEALAPNFAAKFDGRVGVSVGPGVSDLAIAFGVNKSKSLDLLKELESSISQFAVEGLVIERVSANQRAIRLADKLKIANQNGTLDIDLSAQLPRGVKPIERILISQEDDALVLSSREILVPKDSKSASNSAFSAHLQLAGAPTDGSDLADLLQVKFSKLGINLEELRQWISALALLGSFFSELDVILKPRGQGAYLQVEMVTL